MHCIQKSTHKTLCFVYNFTIVLRKYVANVGAELRFSSTKLGPSTLISSNQKIYE